MEHLSHNYFRVKCVRARVERYEVWQWFACGLYVFDARLYIKIFLLVLIVSIARGLCGLDVGLVSRRKAGKLSRFPFHRLLEIAGPRWGTKGGWLFFQYFRTCSGKLIPYFSPRSRALFDVRQSSAKGTKVNGDSLWAC